jgi:DNA-binding XRE family transcriptional regulator
MLISILGWITCRSICVADMEDTIMPVPTNEFGPDADKDLPEEVLEAIANGVMPLSAVRQWKGHSVGDLARIAGVSEEAIQNAEAGGQLVLQEQVALAKSLGVGADLFGSPVSKRHSEQGRQATHESPPQTGERGRSELGRKEIDQSHRGERENNLGRKEIDIPDDRK